MFRKAHGAKNCHRVNPPWAAPRRRDRARPAPEPTTAFSLYLPPTGSHYSPPRLCMNAIIQYVTCVWMNIMSKIHPFSLNECSLVLPDDSFALWEFTICLFRPSYHWRTTTLSRSGYYRRAAINILEHTFGTHSYAFLLCWHLGVELQDHKASVCSALVDEASFPTPAKPTNTPTSRVWQPGCSTTLPALGRVFFFFSF